MSAASERNRRRAMRRRALRLRARRLYLKRYVIDGPDHMIDQLIFTVRANQGFLPPGTVPDSVLAREIEEAVARPFSLIVRALSHGTA